MQAQTRSGGVQELDLSCNNIGALANLGACRQLTRLDLSNNCLSCLARAADMCGGLRRLMLRVRPNPALNFRAICLPCPDAR